MHTQKDSIPKFPKQSWGVPPLRLENQAANSCSHLTPKRLHNPLVAQSLVHLVPVQGNVRKGQAVLLPQRTRHLNNRDEHVHFRHYASEGRVDLPDAQSVHTSF